MKKKITVIYTCEFYNTKQVSRGFWTIKDRDDFYDEIIDHTDVTNIKKNCRIATNKDLETTTTLNLTLIDGVAENQK